jgi:hypothetical protein
MASGNVLSRILAARLKKSSSRTKLQLNAYCAISWSGSLYVFNNGKNISITEISSLEFRFYWHAVRRYGLLSHT